MQNRQSKQFRTPWTQEVSINKWTNNILQEDQMLKELVEAPQHFWVETADKINKVFNNYRLPQTCRERYEIYLKRTDSIIWSKKQTDYMFQLFKLHGPQWVNKFQLTNVNHQKLIANSMTGIDQQQVKNRFYSTVKRVLRRSGKTIDRTFGTSIIISKFFNFKDSIKIGQIKPCSLNKYLEHYPSQAEWLLETIILLDGNASKYCYQQMNYSMKLKLKKAIETLLTISQIEVERKGKIQRQIFRTSMDSLIMQRIMEKKQVFKFQEKCHKYLITSTLPDQSYCIGSTIPDKPERIASNTSIQDTQFNVDHFFDFQNNELNREWSQY